MRALRMTGAQPSDFQQRENLQARGAASPPTRSATPSMLTLFSVSPGTSPGSSPSKTKASRADPNQPRGAAQRSRLALGTNSAEGYDLQLFLSAPKCAPFCLALVFLPEPPPLSRHTPQDQKFTAARASLGLLSQSLPHSLHPPPQSPQIQIICYLAPHMQKHGETLNVCVLLCPKIGSAWPTTHPQSPRLPDRPLR